MCFPLTTRHNRVEFHPEVTWHTQAIFWGAFLLRRKMAEHAEEHVLPTVVLPRLKISIAGKRPGRGHCSLARSHPHKLRDRAACNNYGQHFRKIHDQHV